MSEPTIHKENKLKDYSKEQLQVQLRQLRLAYWRTLKSLERDASNLYSDASSAYENAEGELSNAQSAVESAMDYVEDMSNASDSA